MTLTARLSSTSRSEKLAVLPCIIALFACVVASGFALIKPTQSDPQILQKQAEQDVSRNDYATALLRYQHLLSIDPNQPEHAYQLAQVLDHLHRRQEAMQVLALIAPASGGGYGPAHVQQAEWLMEARVIGGDTNPALIAAARSHLEQPFTDEPTRRRAAALRFAIDAAGN